jgi:hypothetical protein
MTQWQILRVVMDGWKKNNSWQQSKLMKEAK